MKIMIGVDDSPCSQAALEFVTGIAWPPATTMTIISSVMLPPTTSTVPFTPGGLQFEAWLDELTKFHEEVVARDERMLRAAGITVESRVLQGDARETLVEEARRDHVDLLVVGSHGRTGLDKLVMGSVASHVVAHAPCSVLVVKAGSAKPHAR